MQPSNAKFQEYNEVPVCAPKTIWNSKLWTLVSLPMKVNKRQDVGKKSHMVQPLQQWYHESSVRKCDEYVKAN